MKIDEHNVKSDMSHQYKTKIKKKKSRVKRCDLLYQPICLASKSRDKVCWHGTTARSSFALSSAPVPEPLDGPVPCIEPWTGVEDWEEALSLFPCVCAVPILLQMLRTQLFKIYDSMK